MLVPGTQSTSVVPAGVSETIAPSSSFEITPRRAVLSSSLRIDGKRKACPCTSPPGPRIVLPASPTSGWPSMKDSNAAFGLVVNHTGYPAAFSLTTNQISDIVPTLFGYHILKLWEKIPARTEPFSGPDTKATMRRPDGQYVSATIREILTNEELTKQFPDYIKKLRKDADVQVLDEKLKPDLTADASVAPEAIKSNAAAK